MYLKRLKEETASGHERIESRLNLSREDFSLEDFVRILSRHLGWLEPWERRIEDFERKSSENFYADRTKVEWLREDLRDMGLSTEGIARLPRTQNPPRVDDLPSALGSMYVVEGSTLGGGFLATMFQQRFGLSKEHGLRYFTNYGENRRLMWTTFRDVVESRLSDETIGSAVESAAATFESLEAWLMEG